MKKTLFLVFALSLPMLLASECLPAPDEAAKPLEFTGFATLEEAAVAENWKDYFPNQYATYAATSDMIRTTFGGSGENGEKIDYLEIYPFLKIIYAGFPFSESYYRSRGHVYSLEDTLKTGRLPNLDTRPAACLSCKSSDAVVLQEKYGVEWYGRSFAEVVGNNPVGCLDCHSAFDGSVTHQRNYLDTALTYGTFRNINPAGRPDLTCAQCHVNYHFDPNTREVHLPWQFGLTVEDQFRAYNLEPQFNDEWIHPITGALVAKVQHPEYEMYHEGKIRNIHSKIGLGCNDCHMPTMKDKDGNNFSSHQWRSPLTHVELSCMRCHSNWGEAGIIERAEAVQASVYERQNRLGYKLADYIIAVGDARNNGKLTGARLKEAQEIHRKAQFFWDFVWVENSNGFHNWEEAHRILDIVEELLSRGMSLIK